VSAKTKQQVDAEIAALEACKAYAPKNSYFGDDNHRNIDLQIEALRGEIDTTADEWNDFSTEEQSTIQSALDWQMGFIKDSPSSGWDCFKPKKGGKS
jgi:hypothetical protein